MDEKDAVLVNTMHGIPAAILSKHKSQCGGDRGGDTETDNLREHAEEEHFPFNYLENSFPRLHVCEDLNIVGHFGKCGRVVIGVDDQDVDSHWAALLDTIRCPHLEPRNNRFCRKHRFTHPEEVCA